MKFNCISLKIDDGDLFKNRSKRHTFVIRFLTMLNLEMERISLHQLEYEMDRTGYPVYYNVFEIVYCGHPNFAYTNIQPYQSIDLILSHFQKEDHSFINDTIRNKKTQVVYLYFVYKPKENASRTDNTNDCEKAYRYVST